MRLDFREKEERDVEIRAQSANARARIRDDGHEHRLTVDKEVSGNVHREKCGVYRQRRAASGEAPEATFVYQSRPNPESDRNGEREAGVVKERWQKVDEMSVKEVGVAVLFGLETYAWFCVGEIIGRGGSLTGY